MRESASHDFVGLILTRGLFEPMKKSIHLLAVFAVCAMAGLGSADSTAVSLVPAAGNTFNNGGGYTLGYEFTVGSTPITVTSLGYFDTGVLVNSHAVGIFSQSGTLLLSGTVPTGSIPVNMFAYTTALTGTASLAANTSYFIGGVSGLVDPYAFNPTSLSTAPDITYDQAAYTASSTLTFPSSTDTDTGYFGPNFTFVPPAGTPEPMTIGLSLVGLGIAVWRRMKVRAEAA